MGSAERASSSVRLPIIIAIGEWLIILPAVLLIAAALRNPQPIQYETAHTSGIIFEWFLRCRFDADAVALLPPRLRSDGGLGTVFRIWRRDAALRRDSAVAFGILRRQLASCLLVTATLLAGIIRRGIVRHLVTD
jgi:hypothetical protein